LELNSIPVLFGYFVILANMVDVYTTIHDVG